MTPKTHEEIAKVVMNNLVLNASRHFDWTISDRAIGEALVAEALRSLESSLASEVVGVLPYKDVLKIMEGSNWVSDREGGRIEGHNSARQAVLNLFTSRGITME